MELLKQFILFVVGFLTSLYASSVGGLGFLTLPVLVLFGMPISVAIGTNRLVAVTMDGASSLKYYLNNHLKLKVGIILGSIVALGALFGANLVGVLDEEILKYITSVVLVLALVHTIFSSREKSAVFERRFKKRYFIVGVPFLLAVGIYAGMLGIGSGVLLTVIPSLFGYSLLESSGIGRVVGFMSGLVSSYVFITAGLVDYHFAIPMMIGAVIGSWIGITISVKKGERYLKPVLITVLLGSIAQLVFIT